MIIYSREDKMGGEKYQVFKWVEDIHGEYGGYMYVESYKGDYLLMALIDMWKCRRSGVGCVKLEVRDV